MGIKNKGIPAVKHKIRAFLEFTVDVEVEDAIDMAEISREVVRKFRDGIIGHTVSVVEHMVKTEEVI